MHHFAAAILFKALLLTTLFTEVQPAATYLSEKINPKIAQRISRLGNSFKDLPPSALIIVDGDNVRGKTKFSASKEQLCKDLDILVTTSGLDNRVVLMYDHGNEHEAFLFGSLAVCFSGPGRTADDVIARDVVWFQRRFNCPIVVVTADTGLKTRCFQGGRITGQPVTIIDSTLFVELLGATMANHVTNTTATAGTASSPASSSDSSVYSDISNMDVPMNEEKPAAILSVEAMKPFTSERMNVLRRELGVRNQIRSIEKFVKGGCGKKKMVKLQKRAAELDARLKKVISEESVSLGATMEEAMKMSPEFQEAGYNALISMLRAGSTRGREETWERVLLAERFRNTLLAGTLAATYRTQIAGGDGVEGDSSISSSSVPVAITEDAVAAVVDVEVTEEGKEQDIKIESVSATQPVSIIKALDIYCQEINKNFSRTNNTAELIRWIKSKENPIVEIMGSSGNADSVVESSDLVLDSDIVAVSEGGESVTATSDEANDNRESNTVEVEGEVDAVQEIINAVFLIKEVIAFKGFRDDVDDPSELGLTIPDLSGSPAVQLSPLHQQILIQQQRIKQEKEIEAKKREEMTDEERAAPVRTVRALNIMTKSLQGPRQSNNVPFQVTTEGSRIYNLERLSKSPIGSKKLGSRKDLADGKVAGNVVGKGKRSGKVEELPVQILTPEMTGVMDVETPMEGSLRIVCVSDTHGMENILAGSVPDGDIFIHAGDFAADKGKSRLKIKQLDEWMAALPHALKIVVRGNHDPLGGHFPISKAIYAERATSILYRGITIALAPHGTINVPSGNIVVSHEPPFGVLDQAMGRKKPHVGSHALVKSVMKNTEKPQLWIFGHIHEGFGALRTTFGSKGLTTHKMGQPVFSSTLCVNAANANPGPAHSIDHLPICIEVTMLSDVIEVADDGNEMT